MYPFASLAQYLARRWMTSSPKGRTCARAEDVRRFCRGLVEEAQAGESRSDFVHKLGIAQKEARESLYWLRVMAAANIIPQRRIEPLTQETEELLRVITSIILKTKRNSGGLSKLCNS